MVRLGLAMSAAILLLGMQTPAGAHSTSFLPGDAFFHTILTEEKLDSIQEQQDPGFGYRRPEEQGEYLCGDAGYGALRIAGMSKGLKKQLRKVYYDIRRRTPKRVTLLDEETMAWVERNGLHLLFYNADFDFEKFQPFVKYNEDWIEETASFGSAPEFVHLERFVPDWDGSEWRDSPRVPALAGKIVKNAEDDLFSNGFVEIRTPICAVLFTPDDLRKYKARENGAKFHLVTETGIVVYELQNRSWEKVVPDNESPLTPSKDPFAPVENE